MQNNSVFNHAESIVEMQILMVLFFYLMSYQYSDNFGYGDGIKEKSDDAILSFGMSYHDFSITLLFLMLAEHIMTYIFFLVKHHDIVKKGKF